MDIVHFLIFQTGLFSPIYVNLSFSLHKIFSFQTCLICSTLKSFSCHWIEVESQVPASDIRGSLFHRTRWNWKLNVSQDQKGAKQERNHPSKAKSSIQCLCFVPGCNRQIIFLSPVMTILVQIASSKRITKTEKYTKVTAQSCRMKINFTQCTSCFILK